MPTMAGVAKTTANRSLSSKAPRRGSWWLLCQTHRKLCMTYRCVNQAKPSMKASAPRNSATLIRIESIELSADEPRHGMGDDQTDEPDARQHDPANIHARQPAVAPQDRLVGLDCPGVRCEPADGLQPRRHQEARHHAAADSRQHQDHEGRQHLRLPTAAAQADNG